MTIDIKFFRGVVMLALWMLVTAGQLHGANVTVALPKVEGTATREIKVPVRVKGAEGLGPLQLDLVFDAKQLKFIKASEGASGIGLFDFNLAEPGRLRLVMTGDPNKPIQGDGELFAVLFQANDSASGVVPLNVENVRAWEQTAEAYEMLVSVEPGSVNIKAASRSRLLLIAGGVVVAVVLLLIVTHLIKGKPHMAGGSASHARVASTSAAPPPRFCSSCGASLSSASNFCSACGKPING